MAGYMPVKPFLNLAKAFGHWVETAFSSEPFWGVRLEWAKAFGRCLTPASHQAIVHLLPHEPHPQVQAALAGALGNHPSHLSAQLLLDFLARVNIGYLARSCTHRNGQAAFLCHLG